ncbi:peptidoglycan recognition protein family protein [Rhizohabitans arisaemae]|uniref:peptidoglycan recognition protein family protein n=1 Tax=Rhizohabitans arisaemae TaxID=2720610 RepID=UPI0024B1F2BE|nr:peptidoglycan recognition family protein [Rhizohabitans arisaemae]
MSIERRMLLLNGVALAGGLGPAFFLPTVDGWRVRRGVRPRIYSREEWRARHPKGQTIVLNRRPERIVVHHTATQNVEDFSVEAAFRLSRSIQHYHMSKHRWEDIGEHFTISRGGHIMEGRNKTLRAIGRGAHVLGAHAADLNKRAIGIENEGIYTKIKPPARMVKSLVDLLAWLCDEYRLDPYIAIIGHRDVNPTSCPGEQLYAMLPELRRRVAVQLGLPQRQDARRLMRGPRMYGPIAPFDHGPAIGPLDSVDPC